MKGLESFGGSNKLARAARLKVLVVPLLLVFACVFAARPAPTAQQSTAEVCRETRNVLEQYYREDLDNLDLRFIKTNEFKWRGRLSELNRAIANGVVVSGLDLTALMLRLYSPTSTKERLAFQRTLRAKLEIYIQKAADSSLADLEAQSARIAEQTRMREGRMLALKCDEVLAREESLTSEGKLLGCYKDSNNPFAMGNPPAYRSPENTPERCIKACRERGYKYAGVQFGESCLCGNTTGGEGAGTCDMPCTGDKTKICGGRYANSVYTTGIP